MVLGIFKIASIWEIGMVLCDIYWKFWTIFKIFWKTQNLFKKPEYRFLVEITKIDNISFPYKTALSEANVKANKMRSTKWTYHKEQSFVSNFLFLVLQVLSFF